MPSGGGGGGGSGSGLAADAAFPASPSDDDLFLFNAAATGLSDAYDFDGTTAITTAARGDVFKYVVSATGWVRQTAGFNLSDDPPVDVDGVVDRAGTSQLASRADHQHEIGNNEILRQHIADNQIANEHMRDDSIGLAEMADNSVGSPQYIDGSIDPEHLSTSANWTFSTGGDETAVIIQATDADSAAVMRINVGSSGGMKAFQAGRSGESLAWASFEGGLGGSNENPGIAFGPGTGARDVQIYRGGADLLVTPDTFRAGIIDVAAAGLPTTRANLGIVRTFSGLTDTPASYGSAGEMVVINAAADGLEFADFEEELGSRVQLVTVETAYDPTNRQLDYESDHDVRVGDLVMLLLPANLGTSSEAVTLSVVTSGEANNFGAVLNSDLTAVTENQLVASSLIQAVHVTGNRYLLVEPTDLTQAQVEDDAGTHFGLVSGERLAQAVAAHGGTGTTLAANPAGVTSATARLDSITIGTANYNTAHVVLPDASTGDLRAPVATDWDATNGLSRVLAFDGVDLYRAARRLTGAHTSSATFTEVARDTVIDGDTTEDCTWKGVHWTDSLADSTPTVNDCYFNRRESKFRWYYSNGWFDVTSYVVFRGLTYKGEHSSQAEALAAVNGNSEYVIYNDASGNPHLYLTSAYVAGAAGHYIYEWKDANAGLAPDVQSEIELHSSATVTEDADDWVAFTLDRVPGQDSEIELRMTGLCRLISVSARVNGWG